MKQLKIPSGEDFKKLEKIVNFNSQEENYWGEMIKRRDALYPKDDYLGKINFYLSELKTTDGKFKNRIAIERRLKYSIGHAYEWLGTYGLEGHAPMERSEMFEKAIVWYQSADETCNFFTDYVLRQAESCGGAAHFRKQAGLEEEITKAFEQRGGNLISSYLGALTGGPVIILEGPLPEYLKKLADETLDAVAKTYIFKDHTQENRQN